MAYYKVLVIKMLLPNNVIVKRNDVVDELLIQDVKKLEKGGYIAKATKKEIDDFKSKNKQHSIDKKGEKSEPDTKSTEVEKQKDEKAV